MRLDWTGLDSAGHLSDLPKHLFKIVRLDGLDSGLDINF
jgi:hypothetical protein